MDTLQGEEEEASFKETIPLEERRKMSAQCIKMHQGYYPVIVERGRWTGYSRETKRRMEFLLPSYMSMAQVTLMVRSELALGGNEAFYLLTRSGVMVCVSKSLLEVYHEFKDAEDGFLYLTYAAQDVFG